MKRYLLFYGNTAYPKGGMKDLVFSSTKLQDIHDYLKALSPYGRDWYFHWYQIYDMNLTKIIDESPDEVAIQTKISHDKGVAQTKINHEKIKNGETNTWNK